MNILPTGCQTNDCTGIAPDAQGYSLSDALYFNGTPVSVVVNCPQGAVCAPGAYPQVVTFPAGTFIFPNIPQTPGQPIYLSLQGCQSLVSRTLAADATPAEINAAVAEIIQEVAQQLAECNLMAVVPTAIVLSELQDYACLSGVFNERVTADTPGVPVTFGVNGTLPPGLTPSSAANGFEMIISGTPTTAGAYSFTVTASLAPSPGLPYGAYGQRTFTITVVGITTASPLPDATINAIYSETLAVSGITGSVIWGIASGSLPSGLVLNTSTGEITGVPDTLGSSAFTVFVQNDERQCLKSFVMDVTAGDCTAITGSDITYWAGFPEVQVGSGFSYTVLEADMDSGVIFHVHIAAVCEVNVHIEVSWGNTFSWGFGGAIAGPPDGGYDLLIAANTPLVLLGVADGPNGDCTITITLI